MDESHSFSTFRAIGSRQQEECFDDCLRMRRECAAMRKAAKRFREANEVTMETLEQSRQLLREIRAPRDSLR